jgi:hypothetical protein
MPFLNATVMSFFRGFFRCLNQTAILTTTLKVDMKSMIALICQLVGFFLVLAFFFSLANYFFGWHLGMKGAEVPGDPRAAVVFLLVGLTSGAGAYLLSRSGNRKRAKT